MSQTHTQQISWHLLIIILIFSVSFLLVVYSAQSLNLTYDSIEYLAAAKSLSEKGQLQTSNGESFTNWAPLLPMILSPFKGNLKIYGYFNFLIFILLEIGMVLLIIKLIKNQWLRIICSLSLAFSTSLLMQFNFLWSESIFITILIFKILVFFQYQKTKKSIYILILMVLGVLLCLQRYAGLFIIPAVVLSLLHIKKPTKSSVTLSLTYGFISALPLIIWMVTNYEQKGSGFSMFASHLFVNFFPNLLRSYYQDVFFSWFVPSAFVFKYGHFYAFTGVCIWVLFWRMKKINVAISTQQNVLLRIILIYFICLNLIDYSLINEKVKGFDFLSDFERYLSVIYIPIFLIIFSILDSLMNKMGARFQKILIVALFVWILYPISRTLKNSLDWKHYSSSIYQSHSSFSQPEKL